MFIEQLMIKGFGKLSGVSVKLEKGFTIIYGGNESGKTTLQWFIKGMLYGLKGGRASKEGLPAPLKRYKPWSGNEYGGSLQYMLDNGSSYRVDRDFERSTAAVYDSSYNNITGSFDSGKDRGLSFADRHLGLNELCFDKTVLIRQMETRLDGDGSQELVSRLVNLNQTGQEDLSFKKASDALREALKKHIGTDRTTTQPVDKIDARLAQLKEDRKKLAEKRNLQLSNHNELQELILSEGRLKKRKAYLDRIKRIIDGRRQLEEAGVRLSKLSGAAPKLEKAQKELLAAEAELKRLQEVKNSPVAGESLRRVRNRGAGGKSNRIAVLLLLMAAGAAVLPAIRYNPLWFIAAAVLIIAAIAAGVHAKRNGKSKEPMQHLQEDTNSHLQQYEQIMNRVIEFTRNFKDACSEISIAAGIQIEGTAGLEAAVQEKSGAIDALEGQLQTGINDALSAGADYESGFFAVTGLRDIISHSNPEWLKDSWEYEMESLNEQLVQTALKMKEYETLLRGFQEDGEELQGTEEEIAALELRKAELERTGAALRLALEVMTEASQEIQWSFAPVLNSGMSRIIAGITGGRYQDLRADDSLSLNTLSPEAGHIKGVMALSGGTADQMYLSLRLALSDLLSSGKESLPLLLDEVFAQYDDIRTQKTMEYLFNEFLDRQVILFTCKEREVETALKVTGGRVNVIKL